MLPCRRLRLSGDAGKVAAFDQHCYPVDGFGYQAMRECSSLRAQTKTMTFCATLRLWLSGNSGMYPNITNRKWPGESLGCSSRYSSFGAGLAGVSIFWDKRDYSSTKGQWLAHAPERVHIWIERSFERKGYETSSTIFARSQFWRTEGTIL